MGRDSPFPVDINSCLVLPAPCQKFFHLAIIFKSVAAKIIALALERNDSRSATICRDVIAISVGSLVTKLYAKSTYFLTDPPTLN